MWEFAKSEIPPGRRSAGSSFLPPPLLVLQLLRRLIAKKVAVFLVGIPALPRLAAALIFAVARVHLAALLGLGLGFGVLEIG
jgi:hypothetical protein